MEEDLDKYSHKLSIKNNIAYENARNLLEKYISKLKSKNINSNNLIKSAYKCTRVTLNGGYKKKSNKYLINYTLK